jgi:hypothetical protein
MVGLSMMDWYMEMGMLKSILTARQSESSWKNDASGDFARRPTAGVRVV